MTSINCKRCMLKLMGAFWLLVLSMYVIKPVEASVCFLPDESDCGEGESASTHDTGFWPGYEGGDDDNGGGSQCDATYNSLRARNACGDSCVKCTDGGRYNGMYKCPENSCNCNGYISSTATNECGERCERCTISGDRNYGKYKCPTAVGGCGTECGGCIYTASQAASLEGANKDCVECEGVACQGKYRCFDICGISPSGYTYTTSYTSDAADRNNHCEGPCQDSRSDSVLYACDSCVGQNYKFKDENCKATKDPKSGEEYKGKDAGCSGKGGTWYKECCNPCGSTYYSYTTKQTGSEWTCTECSSPCTGTARYHCENSCTGVAKSNDTNCYSYTNECTDANGNKLYTKTQSVKSGYKIWNNSCCQIQCSGFGGSTTSLSGGSSAVETCDPGCGEAKLYKCKPGYHQSGNSCVQNCTPSKTCASYNMSSSSGGCYKTTAVTKNDGCADSLTCYEYACGSEQTCQNNKCEYNSCSDGGYYAVTQNHGCDASGYKVTDSNPRTYGNKTCFPAGTQTACQCTDGGYYTSSQNNSTCDSNGYKKTGSTTVTYGGKTCYTAATQTACECTDGGYVASCTAACSGNSTVTCTSANYGGKTCYTRTENACGSNQTCKDNKCVDSGCTLTAADCASSAQYASGWTVDSNCTCQRKSCPSDTGLLGPSSNIVGVTAPTGQCVHINGPTSSYSGNSQCFSYSILTDSCSSGSLNPSCGPLEKKVKSGSSTCGKQCYTCEPKQPSDCCPDDPCQQWSTNAYARLSELKCTDMSCGSAMGPHLTEVLGHCQATCKSDGSCGTTEPEPRWGCVFPIYGEYLDPYSSAGGKVHMSCEARNKHLNTWQWTWKCTLTMDATYKTCIKATGEYIHAYIKYCNTTNTTSYGGGGSNYYHPAFKDAPVVGNELLYGTKEFESDYVMGVGITTTEEMNGQAANAPEETCYSGCNGLFGNGSAEYCPYKDSWPDVDYSVE